MFFRSQSRFSGASPNISRLVTYFSGSQSHIFLGASHIFFWEPVSYISGASHIFFWEPVTYFSGSQSHIFQGPVTYFSGSQSHIFLGSASQNISRLVMYFSETSLDCVGAGSRVFQGQIKGLVVAGAL